MFYVLTALTVYIFTMRDQSTELYFHFDPMSTGT